MEENANVAPETKSDNLSIGHKNGVVETPDQLDKANSARASIRSVSAESKEEGAEVKVVTHASLEGGKVAHASLEGGKVTHASLEGGKVHVVEEDSSTPLTVSRV